MLGPVLSQIQQKVGIYKAQCSVMVSTLKSRCNNIIVLGIDRVTLIVQYIKSQSAQIKPSIELCHAQFIKAVQLIKTVITLVLHKLGLIGQQLLTTASKIHQRVLSLLKRGN